MPGDTGQVKDGRDHRLELRCPFFRFCAAAVRAGGPPVLATRMSIASQRLYEPRMDRLDASGRSPAW